MKSRKKLALFLCLSLLVHLFLPSCSSAQGLVILDRSGNVMAEMTSSDWDESALKKEGYAAYVEQVLDEAISSLAQKRDLEKSKAKKMLFSGCTVKTNFDPAVFAALERAYSPYKEAALSVGFSVTDLNGGLVAVFSQGEKKENYAAKSTAPYSSFKPLGVYMIALEKGINHWSFMYEDSPVKKIVEEDGSSYDWPPNATGTYSYEETPVATAVMQSLNTVACKALLDVGIRNSVEFLQENLNIPLTSEEMKMTLSGEEEILGNIAMGHLLEGVSPIQMSGYYQIFANGGKYTEPLAVATVENADGEILYEREISFRQVISLETASIMNRMLQRVVGPGGTGEKAAVQGISVGGKTGTGDNGNWFVGFTPQYSVSLWHGTEVGLNVAPDICGAVLGEMDLDPEAQYPACENVKQGIYCMKSGLLYSQNCLRSDAGWYQSGRMPLYCKE